MKPMRQGRSGTGSTVLLVATRKGAWLYRASRDREAWSCEGPHFLGQIVHHLVLDPRDAETLLASASTGHLGPTLFRSRDLGRTWEESRRPPAFAKADAAQAPRAVNHIFWLTPGHASEPGVWYAGTSPHGLFRSEDSGETWAPCVGLNDDPRYREWMGGPQDGTPDGPKRIICTSACRAAACTSQSTAAVAGSRSSTGWMWWRGLMPARPGSTIRTACACARASQIDCISRTTAASIGSTGRHGAGSESASICHARSVTLAFR